MVDLFGSLMVKKLVESRDVSPTEPNTCVGEEDRHDNFVCESIQQLQFFLYSLGLCHSSREIWRVFFEECHTPKEARW